MGNTPTPHIEAKRGEIAKTVLMPGDPLRAKYISENYLENVKCFNKVRGMLGYTGTYKGKEVSVMGSGMGIPSIGIYSYELFNFYDVEQIIRIGSAGSIDDDVNLRDIVLAQSCCYVTDFAKQYNLPGTYSPICDFELMLKAYNAATDMGIKVKAGNVFSTDIFYDDRKDAMAAWKKMGVLCTEMEAPALYANAARAHKKALVILTISDCPFKGLSLSSLDRQTSFTQMMEIALETA